MRWIVRQNQAGARPPPKFLQIGSAKVIKVRHELGPFPSKLHIQGNLGNIPCERMLAKNSPLSRRGARAVRSWQVCTVRHIRVNRSQHTTRVPCIEPSCKQTLLPSHLTTGASPCPPPIQDRKLAALGLEKTRLEEAMTLNEMLEKALADRASEATCVGTERTWAGRDAEARNAAVDLDA